MRRVLSKSPSVPISLATFCLASPLVSRALFLACRAGKWAPMTVSASPAALRMIVICPPKTEAPSTTCW